MMTNCIRLGLDAERTARVLTPDPAIDPQPTGKPGAPAPPPPEDSLRHRLWAPSEPLPPHCDTAALRPLPPPVIVFPCCIGGAPFSSVDGLGLAPITAPRYSQVNAMEWAAWRAKEGAPPRVRQRGQSARLGW